MKIIVTGGAGFIGLNLLKYWLEQTRHKFLVIDKFSYASNRIALEHLLANFPEVLEVQEADISDELLMDKIFDNFMPDSLIHLAAESHVDNSITSSFPFVKSNILGTYSLLETTRKFLFERQRKDPNFFLFHHVSTDEVYGDLEGKKGPAKETFKYVPSSPYSATKACSDHLVTAWGRTFGINYVISNCSNNYGPLQHKEKLIPKVITNALSGSPIPIYGDGQQIRDWLFVQDHVEALHQIFFSGVKNQTFNIGGNAEVTNILLVELICEILQKIKPAKYHYRKLITMVDDRLGHDRRYSIDYYKLKKQLGWSPKINLNDGLTLTIIEYLRGLET
ncbi:dTDP-glucose 4,6-dehydratase [Alphaproteobacteria bacterium]|nr:dTDP-glucose 4,6-dehydratase [Alphaproteobacteria bacterium]